MIDSDESTSSRSDSESENVNRFDNMALRPTCSTWKDDRDSLSLSFLLFFLEAFPRCFLSLRSELSWWEELDLSSFLLCLQLLNSSRHGGSVVIVLGAVGSECLALELERSLL